MSLSAYSFYTLIRHKCFCLRCGFNIRLFANVIYVRNFCKLFTYSLRWTNELLNHSLLTISLKCKVYQCVDIYNNVNWCNSLLVRVGMVWTFLPSSILSLLSPSLWETARYRLKYCLKGTLNPKQPTNQLLVRFSSIEFVHLLVPHKIWISIFLKFQEEILCWFNEVLGWFNEVFLLFTKRSSQYSYHDESTSYFDCI